MDKNVSKKLKSFETVNWLKNRFKNQVKDKYILNERELKEQIMMKAVFKSIDRDQSKFLDRQELYDMFRRYGINITKTKLREFFKRIDQDEDDKLNWNDFKQALQNQEALQMFVELMRKIRESSEKRGKTNELNFVPLSFPNMIQYMNYCVLREELIQKIKSDQLNTHQKVKQCTNLLSLEDICYNKVIEIKDDEEDKEEAAFIKMAKRKNDHQQIALLKRLQEKEQNEQRQKRIRKLSTSQYYKSDTENTSRSVKRNNQNSVQYSCRIQNTEFKLIEHIIQQNSKVELPILSNETQKISSPMMMSERINLNESETHFQYNKKPDKQETRTSSVPRGAHYTNQYMMNIRTPVKVFERQRLQTPKRVRVISHTELSRFNTKQQF